MNWISVKERMPDEGAYVLVCNNIYKVRCCSIYRHERFDVYDLLSEDLVPFEDPTHWMPLPEPPKSKDNGI